MASSIQSRHHKHELACLGRSFVGTFSEAG